MDRKRSLGPPENGSTSAISTVSKSMIQMQVSALLEEQSVNYEAQSRKLNPWLEEVQRAVLSIPPREPVLAHQIESTLKRGDSRVRVPYPTVHPTEDAKHRYGFAPPTKIEVVGSFVLQTLIRDEIAPLIDIAITIPPHLLEPKDYLDHRYIHKKAYYLACVAQGLTSTLKGSFELAYAYQDDNELQPCLILTLNQKQYGKGCRWNRLRILVCPPAGLFRPDKLRPWTSCLRDSSARSIESQGLNATASSLYNGTIASERLIESYHAILLRTTGSCPGFRNACKLGKIWLRQRGFSSTITCGGFGAFEFGSLLALLLQGEHNMTGALVSPGNDGYQLFRALIQVLATRDCVKEPLIFGKLPGNILGSLEREFPMCYDTEREHNLIFKMSLSSYFLLKDEAKTTLNALMQPDPYKFYPAFIARLGRDPIRFDHVLEGTLKLQPRMILQMIDRLYTILTAALRDRALLVHVGIQASDTPREWPCSSLSPRQAMRNSVRIGVLADAVQIARRVDLGPVAEETEAATKYREFWGDKAELRRFANGDIRESVTWPNPRNDADILNLIVSHVLARHFPDGAVTLSESNGNDFSQLLSPSVPTSQALLAFSPVEDAFKELQESLRAVSGHPLRLRQVSGSAAGLRFASVQPAILASSKRKRPLDVVVQFEGSIRWPEDIIAIQHTKVALLAKIAELLEGEGKIDEAIVGLENVESNFGNRAFLDLTMANVSFRLRIYHDHEASLLNRLLKDGSLNAGDRAMAATALSTHKRNFIHGPRHTQAIHEACTRMPLLSPAMRLFKLWVSSHLLLPHFRDELLELLAVHAFAYPYPYMIPGSLRTAFLRILLFLSKWDWHNEPLAINLATSPFARSDFDSIMINFQAWRKIDPSLQRVALFVASNVDLDGSTWSLHNPNIVAMNRLVSLSKAACMEVDRDGTDLQAQTLFTHSLDDFDFVIHLDQSRSVSKGLQSRATKSSEINAIHSSFIEELETTFSGYVAFFHNRGLLPIVAGIWVPKCSVKGVKLGSSWLTIPEHDTSEPEPMTLPNKTEILHQIASLGGDLIADVSIKDKS